MIKALGVFLLENQAPPWQGGKCVKIYSLLLGRFFMTTLAVVHLDVVSAIIAMGHFFSLMMSGVAGSG
jgi:hypothetical protein